jgi:hypothetical protein
MIEYIYSEDDNPFNNFNEWNVDFMIEMYDLSAQVIRIKKLIFEISWYELISFFLIVPDILSDTGIRHVKSGIRLIFRTDIRCVPNMTGLFVN